MKFAWIMQWCQLLVKMSVLYVYPLQQFHHINGLISDLSSENKAILLFSFSIMVTNAISLMNGINVHNDRVDKVCWYFLKKLYSGIVQAAFIHSVNLSARYVVHINCCNCFLIFLIHPFNKINNFYPLLFQNVSSIKRNFCIYLFILNYCIVMNKLKFN